MLTAGIGYDRFFAGVMEFMVSPMLTPLAEAFSVTPAQSSWLIAVYTLSYAIAAPFMGRISDRVNRYRLSVAIQSEYNGERPHESLNNLTPEEYEQQQHHLLAEISKSARN